MRLIRTLAKLGFVLAMVPACKSDPADGTGDWYCGEGYMASSCSCQLVPPRDGNFEVVVGSEVASCGQYSCCLLTEEETEWTLATCECLETQDCQAEAASRRGATVVPACPPGSDPTARCAALDENCRPEYLSENGLTGCCEGTICRENSVGIPVCEMETEADQLCAELPDGVDDFEVIEATVVTSLGTFTFNEVGFSLLQFGSGGCVRGVTMDFGSASGCSLTVSAGLSGSMLRSSSVSGSLYDCPGFQGASLFDGVITDGDVGLSFGGISCDRGSVFEEYCFSGTFEWHATVSTGSATFENQRLIATGFGCSTFVSGECNE